MRMTRGSEWGRGVQSVHRLDWKSLDFKVDAGDVGSAILMAVAGALAEFSKADVPVLTELQPGRNEDAVDVDAGLTFELEEHIDCSGIVGAAAEHPTANSLGLRQ